MGNSSSGLLEAPSFKIGTINIGDRQEGRIQAASVINCKATSKDISNSLKTIYSEKFQHNLKNVENPYGHGDASNKIFKIIRDKKLPVSTKKRFYKILQNENEFKN